MRGFGATQVPIAHEQQMDILAEKLGLDPVSIRMKNIFKKKAPLQPQVRS